MSLQVRGRTGFDMLLVGVIIALLLIGVVMVYSASAALGLHKYGDAFYFAKRQALFAFIGVIGMFCVANLHPQYFYRLAWPILLGCVVLLSVVWIPGVGIFRNGARSWLGVGSFSIQPAEFAKLALINFLAHYVSVDRGRLYSFWRGFLPSLGLISFIFGLIMLQPDLGTGTVLAGTGFVLLLAAGARWMHLGSCILLGLMGFIGLVLAAPYRIQRIAAFLDPWQDPLGAGYHLIQSLFAIGPGGLLGLGLGMSRQKHLYLPEPHTDFIFSILAEETGFVGGSVILILLGLFVWRGLRIALRQNTLFGSLLAAGITIMILLQSLLNIGVVTGMFPVTGVTLSFLSYGGSSLTLTLLAVGILLSLSCQPRWFVTMGTKDGHAVLQGERRFRRTLKGGKEENDDASYCFDWGRHRGTYLSRLGFGTFIVSTIFRRTGFVSWCTKGFGDKIIRKN